MPNNYVLLDRIELNATTTSVTFDNIPQSGYTDLKIVVSARGTASGEWNDLTAKFNSSTTGYSQRYVYGTGSAVASNTGGYSAGYAGHATGTSATANTFSNVEIYIPNYRGSNQKSFSFDSVTENNATTSLAMLGASLWSGTGAITSIVMELPSSSFVAGSTFSLYGIAQVGTTPTIAPKADGGNIIATDGTYWYHAFLSNGTFTPQVALSADVLVVAGGGGGGASAAGGGGAGGLLGFTAQSLTTTSYTCTVGAGGSANGVNTDGSNGVNSQFGALTAAVGGGGGASNQSGNAGKNGGSGGGGATFTGNPSGGNGTSGQGNNGAAGNNSGSGYGGGGGGANAAGNTAAGGNGSSVYSSWGLATTTGQNVSGTVYYAGGGGGSRQFSSSPAATGGYGGGATGALSGSNAVAATANTGGGGGGGWDQGSALGSNGGSGIIIVRYLVA